MKKYIGLLLALLLALPVHADYSGPSFGGVVSYPIASAQGGTGANTSSGMSTATSDNSVPLQAAITARDTANTTAGSVFNDAPIFENSGKYTFTNGVTAPPYTKIIPLGPVKWDFSGAATNIVAFNSTNQNVPGGDYFYNYNSANQGPFISGAMGSTYIYGPGATGTSIGVQMGNTTGASSDANYRNASMQGVTIAAFNTCINIRGVNTYMLDMFYGGGLYNCNVAIQSPTTVTNSGEKLRFNGWVMGGGANYGGSGMTILDLAGPDMDFGFSDVSWDFQNYGAVIETGATSGVEFITASHIENTEYQIIKSNLSSTYAPYMRWVVSNSKIVPTSLSPANNRPNRALFTGYFSLDGISNFLGGWANPSNDATHGMFLIDGSVNIINFIGYLEAGSGQLIAQQTLLNNDPFFAQGTVGNDMQANPPPTWTTPFDGGITAQISSSNPLSAYGGSKSVQYTSTQNGSNYYLIESNWFPVKPGQRLIADASAYGGTSTGTMRVELQFYYRSSNSALPLLNDTSGGDNYSSVYAENTDPAWVTGNARTYSAKMNTLHSGVVPAGYDSAYVRVTMSGLNTSDVTYINFVGVNGL